MPIIPRGSQNVRLNVSSPVPIKSSTDARLQGDTLADAGSIVMKFAEQQISADRRIKFDEGTNAIRNIAPEAHDFASRNSAPDGSDYSKKYYEYAEPRVKEAQNTYGTDATLKERLGSFVNMVKNDQDTAITIKSAEMMEKHSYVRMDGLQNDSANRLRENPNPAMVGPELMAHGALIADLVKSGAIPSQNAPKLIAAFKEKMATQFIEGLSNRQQFGKALAYLQANQEDPNLKASMPPDQAQKLGFIDPNEAKMLSDKGAMFELPVMTKGDKAALTPEMTILMQGLEPKQKAHLIDSMKAQLKQKTEVRLSDLNAQVNGFEIVAKTGQPIDMAQVADMKKQINLNPNLTPAARIRAMDSINTAVALNQQLQLTAVTPRSQWASLSEGMTKKIELASQEASKYDPKMSSAGNDFAVQANRLQAHDSLTRALEGMKKTQEADAALFVVQTDPQLQNLYRGIRDGDPKGTENYVNNVLAKQNFLGIPADKQRILPKGDAANIANTLAVVPDAAAANEQLTVLQNQYGRNFPRIMHELSQSNKALADYKAVAYVAPLMRESLIDAIKNQSSIKKNIMSDAALVEKNKMLTVNAAKVMSNFRTSIFGSVNDSGSTETINSLQSMVVLQAQRDMVRNRDAEPADLVEKAYGDIVNSQYAIVAGGKSSAIIPRQMGSTHLDPKIIRTYMDVYSKPENLSDLQLAIPKAQASEPDKYINELANRSKWVTNPTQTGIKLMQVYSDGSLQPVYDKYQRPIEKNFEDIHFHPGKKVIEANKGTWQKLFGN